MTPNVLLIQCDDLSPDDLGMEGPFTPALCALKNESFSAADFSVQPVCSPSRAALLTGRHSLRTGVSHVHGGKDFLHRDEITLAERFRNAGYSTGMWGKWHLGHSEGYYPWQRGFDEAYMADLYHHRHTGGRLNGIAQTTDKWADEHIVDLALEYIGRRKDRPWFAYVPTLTPHTPHDAPEHWVRFHLERGCPPGLAVNRAMVSFLDEQIGRLLAGLAAEGLAENTLVIFLSDHGPAIAASELDENDRRIRNSSGRRGWKGDLYENGVQSPLLIRWPGKVSSRVFHDPIQLLDLPATLMDLCGVPHDQAEGRSFATGLLKGESFETGDIFTYAHRGWLTSGPPYSLTGIPGEYNPEQPGAFMEQCLSIRRGRYKMILNPDFSSDEEVVLYDVLHDPGEENNLAEAFPAIRGTLIGRLEAWWSEILSEKHAFQPPVLRIQPGENMFAANLPCHVEGGAVNGVNGVTGWEHPGARITYVLEGAQSGRIWIDLIDAVPEYDRQPWKLELSTGETAMCVPGTSAEMTLPTGRCFLSLTLPGSGPEIRLRKMKMTATTEPYSGDL